MSKKEVLTPYQYGEKACRENKAFLSFMDKQFEKNHIDGKNLEEMRVSDAEWCKGFQDESARIGRTMEDSNKAKNKLMTPYEYGEKSGRGKKIPSSNLDKEFFDNYLSGKDKETVESLEAQWIDGYMDGFIAKVLRSGSMF
ncbi:hypothetical protein WKH56_09250 [Priestia sp. SB1]|uniref:hypothetical protein n=1 Tax=Priestia sp. SB1 TaxID=3132359 RepID=UPI003177C369